MRAFIGIGLPEHARTSLAGLQRQLAGCGADVNPAPRPAGLPWGEVKWVKPHHLHLTMKFLGEISVEQRGAIEVWLKQVTMQQLPFTIRLEGVGAFPSPNAARVVWVGVAEGREPLTRLAESIEERAAAMELPREEHAFSPHLTIGRVRSPRGRKALSDCLASVQWQPPEPWTVASVTLYRSDLSPRGPAYTVLADVPLGTSVDSP